MEYFEKGIDVLQNLAMENSEDALMFYKRYADALNGIHKTQFAIENLKHALQIAQGTVGERSSIGAQIYYSLGNSYLHRGDKNSAKKYYELASEIRMGLPEKEKKVGETYRALAVVRMGESN